eukprot:gene3250-8245_t
MSFAILPVDFAVTATPPSNWKTVTSLPLHTCGRGYLWVLVEEATCGYLWKRLPV